MGEKVRYIMEKRKGKGIRILNGIIILICFFFIFVCAVDFSASAKKQLEENITDSLKRNSEYLENNINGKTNDILSTLEAYSIFIATFDNIHDAQVFQTLSDANAHNQFLNITIDTLDGKAKDIDGNAFDVSDRTYFQEAVKGKKVVSEVVLSKTHNQPCVAFAVPIYKNGKVEGVLHTSIAIASMEEHFRVRPVFAEGTVFIVDQNGQLILGPEDSFDKDNLFKSFKTEAAKNNNGHFLKEINGEMKDVYYSYEKTSGWYIFTLVNEAVITNQTAKTNQLAFVLVVRIAVILAVLVYFLMLWERKQNKEVKRRMIEMNTILSNSPGGAMCYMIDRGKLTLQFISEGACEIFGLSLADAREKLLRGYSQYIHSEDYQEDMRLVSEHNLPELYYRIVAPKNRIKWVVDRRCFIEAHDVQYVYISILDITNMMHMQEELFVSEAKQRMILEDTNLMYFDYEIDKSEIHFSKGWMEYSGYPEKISITSQNPSFAFNLGKVSLSKEEMTSYVNEHGHNFQEDHKLSLMNGTQRWLRLKGSIILDQRNIPTHIIAVMEDIDDMKRVHEELEEKTMMDGLTGIYNKESAEKFIRQKLSETTLLTQQVLFVIDVDNFKEVNDTFGHLEGDEVLSQLGFKLNGCFRKADIVGRIGGDEFIALMSDVGLDANDTIEERAKQIIQAVEEVSGKNVDVNVTCSVGIAIYPKDGSDYDELFKKADMAMYHMKISGKSNYSFYQK